MKLFLLPSLALSAAALDIQVSSVTCDQDLPIYALDGGITVGCDGSDRCTFGEEATLGGLLIYNNVSYSGVSGTTVYASSDMTFFSLSYHLFEDFPMDLCENFVQVQQGLGDDDDAAGDDAGGRRRLNDGNNNGQGGCPEDGIYEFNVTYPLPGADERTAWLATGWSGSADITFYAAEDSPESMVGYCTFTLTTMVTTNAAQRFQTPTAATSAFVLLGLFVAFLCCCFYCVCCRRAPRNTQTVQQAQSKDDPISEYYNRMEDQSASGQNSPDQWQTVDHHSMPSVQVN